MCSGVCGLYILCWLKIVCALTSDYFGEIFYANDNQMFHGNARGNFLTLIQRTRNLVQAFDCVWQPFTMHSTRINRRAQIWCDTRCVCIMLHIVDLCFSFHSILLENDSFFIMCWIYRRMMVVRNHLTRIHWMLPRCHGKCGTHTRKSKAFKWRMACGWRRVLPSPHTVRRRYAAYSQPPTHSIKNTDYTSSPSLRGNELYIRILCTDK